VVEHKPSKAFYSLKFISTWRGEGIIMQLKRIQLSISPQINRGEKSARLCNQFQKALYTTIQHYVERITI